MSKYEFGGPIGVVFFIIWSHCLLYYFWYCVTFNNGNYDYPKNLSQIVPFFQNILQKICLQAIPNFKIFGVYFAFIASQFILASFMPGIRTKGLPLPQKKDQCLPYFCNAYSCYYLTMATLLILNYYKVLSLSYIYDNLGGFLTSAIIFSNLSVLLIHYWAVLTKNAERMTGNFIYDLFMGAYLNPRFGIVDIKMVAEVRVSWLLLQILALSSAFKQYETYGYVSKEMICINIFYWFYSNACAKGEHYIPTTWDMFYEKFGWMLNFWNFAGVPFLYSIQANFIFINQVNHSNLYCLVIIALNFIAYYFFDTCNFHKNDFRMRERGIEMNRKTFPVLPYSKLKDPQFIQTPYGKLLIDGWYKYARKLHYTADICQALSWGLMCGFSSLLPYFYVSFFTIMIIHRWRRDDARCAQKYKEHWEAYKKKVPYVFIPYII